MPARPRRGRRPKTYAAVLEATARLLATTSLAELSVADILAAAGVGRTSFYEHFGSKEDVVVKLMETVSDEIGDEIEPMFAPSRGTPGDAIREGITHLIETSARYAPLLAAVAEEWPTIPELRAIWLRVQGEFTLRLARLIDRERAAGVAPPGADSRALAASLVWTAERVFHLTVTGSHPTLRNERDLIDPLHQLFVGAIYGRLAQPAMKNSPVVCTRQSHPSAAKSDVSRSGS